MAIWYTLWPFGTYILWPFGIFYGQLVYFMAIWYILWPVGIFYGHLVYFMAILVYFLVIWHIFSRFGMLHQEKSGNPGSDVKACRLLRLRREVESQEVEFLKVKIFLAGNNKIFIVLILAADMYIHMEVRKTVKKIEKLRKDWA
jgi:hypothetical protein